MLPKQKLTVRRRDKKNTCVAREEYFFTSFLGMSTRARARARGHNRSKSYLQQLAGKSLQLPADNNQRAKTGVRLPYFVSKTNKTR